MINEKNVVTNNYTNNIYCDDFIIEKEEFQLIKNNVIYFILIITQNNSLIIKCQNYLTKLDLNEISNLFFTDYSSIEQPYIYIINLFKEGKVRIKEISINKVMKLMLNDTIKKEINLIYNTEPNNFIFYQKITKDSFSSSPVENTFTIFNTLNNNLYLIYATKDKSIKCLNLMNNQMIVEIKDAHNKFITNFKHYYYSKQKIDLIMSISSDDNAIKIWNVNNWDCKLYLKNINKSGNLLSACLFEENNNIYIVTSNFDIYDEPEPIKIYDIKGNKVKEIMNSNKNTLYIKIYCDKNTSINYIITCNINFIKSYDYNRNMIYHRYYENNNSFHNSVIVKNYNNIVKLIESCNDGNIRIWDFHSNSLLNKIKVDNSCLTSICSWDEDYILIGCKNKGIKIIKIDEGTIKNVFKTKNAIIYTIKIINHPKYGKSLITQGTFFEQIKIWIN